jgi:hypothetical protein
MERKAKYIADLFSVEENDLGTYSVIRRNQRKPDPSVARILGQTLLYGTYALRDDAERCARALRLRILSAVPTI